MFEIILRTAMFPLKIEKRKEKIRNLNGYRITMIIRKTYISRKNNVVEK